MADRITVLGDLAYAKENRRLPLSTYRSWVAHVIIEIAELDKFDITAAIRQSAEMSGRFVIVPQDTPCKNQEESIHCGDNGIFKNTTY